MKAQIPDLDEQNAQKLLTYFELRCAYCSTPLFRSEWHRDHYLPKSWADGKDHASNIVPACPRCNTLKSSSPPERFIRQVRELGFEINPKLFDWLRLEGDKAEAWKHVETTEMRQEKRRQFLAERDQALKEHLAWREAWQDDLIPEVPEGAFSYTKIATYDDLEGATRCSGCGFDMLEGDEIGKVPNPIDAGLAWRHIRCYPGDNSVTPQAKRNQADTEAKVREFREWRAENRPPGPGSDLDEDLRLYTNLEKYFPDGM